MMSLGAQTYPDPFGGIAIVPTKNIVCIFLHHAE
jgi:hypothetical protein